MKPEKILPDQYTVQKTLDLSKKSILIVLNLAAIPILFLSGWFFYKIIISLRQTTLPVAEIQPSIMTIKGGWSAIGFILIFLVVVSITILVHELIHGLFYWIYTRAMPVFGFKGAYAFAAAPDWFIPRNQFIMVGLSPLVLIPLIVLLVSPFIPYSLIPILITVAGYNTAGAMGDIISVVWALTFPVSSLVCDKGDRLYLYHA